MTPTPAQKFILLSLAGALTGLGLFWADIQPEVLALGLDENVSSILTKALRYAAAAGAGLLTLLGTQAPTKGGDDAA